MHEFEWGFLIVNYLFLGGISAGTFFASALAAYLGSRNGEPEGFERIARTGAWIAPWPVAFGSLLLIFDLGNWWRFYKLFLHFEWTSPMSIGSWLLLLFSGVAMLYFWAWLPEERRARVLELSRVPPKWRAWTDLTEYRRLLAAIGFPLSVSVGIYTGVLLGAVQARPFWNTNLVAQMFLFSALSSGCALLIAVLSFSRDKLSSAQLGFLYTHDVCLITGELLIVIPYVLHGELSPLAIRKSLELILGGPYTFAFWVLFLVLGLLVPLALEAWELLPSLLKNAELHHHRRLAAGVAALVILGGYTLRYVFVFAGQMSVFQ